MYRTTFLTLDPELTDKYKNTEKYTKGFFSDPLYNKYFWAIGKIFKHRLSIEQSDADNT
jgi:hypothetical protein